MTAPVIYVPRLYQAEGEERIITTPGGGFGYFAEPGGGKTVTALTAADRLMHDLLRVDRTLVVGPKMVAQEVWHREARKWAHLQHLDVRLITAQDFGYRRYEEVAIAEGVEVKETEVRPEDKKAVRRALLDSPQTIHVVSRDHLYWLVKCMGSKWPYKLVLGDESTSFKNHMSNRSRALRFLRRKGLIDYITLMSGTPMPKTLEQFWAQVLILDNGERLGTSQTKFREEFMVPDKRDRDRIFSWKPARGAVEEVMSRVSDICLSVRAETWRQNEPPLVVPRRVALPAEAMELYDRIQRDYVLQFGESEVLAQNPAVLSAKLSQLASGAVLDSDKKWHLVHDAKLDALEDLVEELAGEPILVLYWFKSSLERLKKRFGRKLATTATSGFLDKFAARDLPILALQPSGAGHGLDGLQHGGHHVAAFDLHPDWEVYKQAVDRLDRSGQQYQVKIWQLIAEGTVDEAVAATLFERGSNNGKVMDAIAWHLTRGRAPGGA